MVFRINGNAPVPVFIIYGIVPFKVALVRFTPHRKPHARNTALAVAHAHRVHLEDVAVRLTHRCYNTRCRRRARVRKRFHSCRSHKARYALPVRTIRMDRIRSAVVVVVLRINGDAPVPVFIINRVVPFKVALVRLAPNRKPHISYAAGIIRHTHCVHLEGVAVRTLHRCCNTRCRRRACIRQYFYSCRTYKSSVSDFVRCVCVNTVCPAVVVVISYIHFNAPVGVIIIHPIIPFKVALVRLAPYRKPHARNTALAVAHAHRVHLEGVAVRTLHRCCNSRCRRRACIRQYFYSCRTYKSSVSDFVRCVCVNTVCPAVVVVISYIHFNAPVGVIIINRVVPFKVALIRLAPHRKPHISYAAGIKKSHGIYLERTFIRFSICRSNIVRCRRRPVSGQRHRGDGCIQRGTQTRIPF